MDLRIEPIKPLLDLRTPLRLIPRFWLEVVEPRIRRVGSCWLWEGALDFEGEPVVTIKNLESGTRTTRRIKRIIAEHYWDLQDEHNVVHSCNNRNCLAPAHFFVTLEKSGSKALKAEIKRLALRISRWGKSK